jgi:hypothetical protein
MTSNVNRVGLRVAHFNQNGEYDKILPHVMAH